MYFEKHNARSEREIPNPKPQIPNLVIGHLVIGIFFGRPSVQGIRKADELKKTLVMLLAGGQGERLYPLTRDRAKPAVPFGGIYRIIDFTLSNCINAGIRKMLVLTQY